MKILVIEDDRGLVDLLSEVLKSHHYHVEAAYDGPPGLALATSFSYDLILIDLGLPTLDGISLCQQLRSKGVAAPILLMTVEDAQSAKVQALDAGADDYLVKPIDPAELLARIRALLRRCLGQATPLLTWGPICLDPAASEVSCHGNPLHLTAKEYGLLELFLRHPQQIFDAERLINQLWSLETTPTHNAVRARIKSLRDKLQARGAHPIETVHGMGYRLATEPTTEPTPQSSSTPVKAIESGLSFDLAPIWKRHRQEYFEYVAVLEQAIFGLKTHSYTQGMQQRAQRAAHTLKGTLGSFGLSLAGQLASDIETLLQTVTPVNQTDLNKLISCVCQLKLELERLAPPVTAQLLIVHSDRATGEQLVAEAAIWGMFAEAVTTLAQAQNIVTQLRPHLVLLDLVSLDLLNQTAEILMHLGPPCVPIIALTGQIDLSTRVQASQLGEVQLLQTPLSAAQIMTAVRQTLHKSFRYPIKLLVIDDDRTMLALLRHWLEPLGFDLTPLHTPGDFWIVLERTVPDMVILDINMPGFSGIELCQAIRRDRTWQKLPVIFLSAHRDIHTAQKAFAAGADDLLYKPTSKTEVLNRLYNRLQRSHWNAHSHHLVDCLCT